MVSQGFTLSVLRLQEAWELCAHGHRVVNIFHLVGEAFTFVKQLRKCAPDTVIQVLQRGAKAKDTGKGPVPRRPERVLLVTCGTCFIFFRDILLTSHQSSPGLFCSSPGHPDSTRKTSHLSSSSPAPFSGTQPPGFPVECTEPMGCARDLSARRRMGRSLVNVSDFKLFGPQLPYL